jgi:hypothetical protein
MATIYWVLTIVHALLDIISIVTQTTHHQPHITSKSTGAQRSWGVLPGPTAIVAQPKTRLRPRWCWPWLLHLVPDESTFQLTVPFLVLILCAAGQVAPGCWGRWGWNLACAASQTWASRLSGSRRVSFFFFFLISMKLQCGLAEVLINLIDSHHNPQNWRAVMMTPILYWKHKQKRSHRGSHWVSDWSPVRSE